jgi:hypothetical protein
MSARIKRLRTGHPPKRMAARRHTLQAKPNIGRSQPHLKQGRSFVLIWGSTLHLALH